MLPGEAKVRGAAVKGAGPTERPAAPQKGWGRAPKQMPHLVCSMRVFRSRVTELQGPKGRKKGSACWDSMRSQCHNQHFGWALPLTQTREASPQTAPAPRVVGAPATPRRPGLLCAAVHSCAARGGPALALPARPARGGVRPVAPRERPAGAPGLVPGLKRGHRAARGRRCRSQGRGERGRAAGFDSAPAASSACARLGVLLAVLGARREPLHAPPGACWAGARLGAPVSQQLPAPVAGQGGDGPALSLLDG